MSREYGYRSPDRYGMVRFFFHLPFSAFICLLGPLIYLQNYLPETGVALLRRSCLFVRARDDGRSGLCSLEHCVAHQRRHWVSFGSIYLPPPRSFAVNENRNHIFSSKRDTSILTLPKPRPRSDNKPSRLIPLRFPTEILPSFATVTSSVMLTVCQHDRLPKCTSLTKN